MRLRLTLLSFWQMKESKFRKITINCVSKRKIAPVCVSVFEFHAHHGLYDNDAARPTAYAVFFYLTARVCAVGICV